MTLINHGFPVQRPGLITSAFWEGDDDDLQLVVQYTDENGNGRQTEFHTRHEAEGHPGELCLPSSADIHDVPEDALIASIRMGALITRSIAGSSEFLRMFNDHEDANDIETAIGGVKVSAVRILDEISMAIDVQKNGAQEIRTITTDHNSVSRYILSPSTQMSVIPGAIEKAHPGYVHDFPGTVLTQAQRDDVVDLVKALTLWV